MNRNEKRHHIIFIAPHLIVNTPVVISDSPEWRAMSLSTFPASETRKASQRCDQRCVVFRGQGPVAAAALSRRSLHYNKENLNALLFYLHCCKILQGQCGPYKTESCQIHRKKARVWFESDALFMLATLRGLLSELQRLFYSTCSLFLLTPFFTQ